LTVSPRLYNFGGQNGASDPTLDANYTATLRGQCKPGDNATLVYLDPPTPTTFDADYYTLVAGNKGLLSTDAALLLDATTSAYVERQANATAPPGEFFADFATSFHEQARRAHAPQWRDQTGLLQGQPAGQQYQRRRCPADDRHRWVGSATRSSCGSRALTLTQTLQFACHACIYDSQRMVVASCLFIMICFSLLI
jgi:hypothetical protein